MIAFFDRHDVLSSCVCIVFGLYFVTWLCILKQTMSASSSQEILCIRTNHHVRCQHLMFTFRCVNTSRRPTALNKRKHLSRYKVVCFPYVLKHSAIECVRLTSSNSKIQNKRPTKGFVLIRHKRYQSYSCLQLSSSIASFVWKPAHFEFRSYGGA